MAEDGFCTFLVQEETLLELLEVLLIVPFGRFTLEDKPRILSADTSVLGSEVHAGIRGAGRSFCSSFAFGVTGLTPFCHSLVIGVFSVGWFTRTFLAPVALPLGAGRSHAGFTIDLPPTSPRLLEIPRLTFF
mgnify:FL=1